MTKEIPNNLFEGNRWELPASDLKLCSEAVNKIEERLLDVWQDQDSIYDIMPAISDLFWNAVVHGSYGVSKKDKVNQEELWPEVIKRLGLTTDKKVTITLDIQPNYMEISFKDEGPGYDPSEDSLSSPELENEEKFAATGRGKKFINESGFFDEVIYDKINKSVTVKKRRAS